MLTLTGPPAARAASDRAGSRSSPGALTSAASTLPSLPRNWPRVTRISASALLLVSLITTRACRTAAGSLTRGRPWRLCSGRRCGGPRWRGGLGWGQRPGRAWWRGLCWPGWLGRREDRRPAGAGRTPPGPRWSPCCAHRVVQGAGDPQPLLGKAPGCLRLAFLLGKAEPVSRLGGQGPPAAHRVAEHDRQSEHHDGWQGFVGQRGRPYMCARTDHEPADGHVNGRNDDRDRQVARQGGVIERQRQQRRRRDVPPETDVVDE